ncbi:MAG TPA: YmdB family metallophosphoesterase, partial [Candidatus Ozemobacteraceae bacterium]|nr:YmdB family metallophosphoesterase [Candidatus Ozemobacteraceae bacterium]
MKILFIGDIYGRAGRTLVSRELPALRQKLACDWVVANAENVSGGVGLSPGHFKELCRAGVDVCTMGNHLFARRDWPDLVKDERVLRPHNLGGDALPGKGWGWYQGENGKALGVINVAGRVFMEPAECPFRWVEALLERLPHKMPVICDFHAEATSE